MLNYFFNLPSITGLINAPFLRNHGRQQATGASNHAFQPPQVTAPNYTVSRSTRVTSNYSNAALMIFPRLT